MSESYKALSDNKVIKHLAKFPGDQQMFAEFYARFHKLICYMIIKTCREYRVRDVALDENDLIQNFYLRLFDQQGRALKSFRGKRKRSAVSWLAMCAKYLVQNKATQIHPFVSLQGNDRTRLAAIIGPQGSQQQIDYEDLIRMLEACLNEVAGQYKDVSLHKLIFRLWLDEIDPVIICDWMSKKLTVKSVQNKISQMKTEIRKCLDTWLQ